MRDRELKSTVRDYSLSYSRWKASSKILSDPGSSDLGPAIVAGTDQDGDPAVDVSFIAPLPKCHFFPAFINAPSFADFTNGGFVSGGHRPIPSASPKLGQSARYVLRGCELPHTREGFEIDRLTNAFAEKIETTPAPSW